ncbi:RNA polymerase sigma factor [Fibrella arboris]|uniref:RNA polymerase sigma factor n=1 Tax=Fibrella arboris TaxID=3242486 RepID=UPI00352019C8
MFVFTTQRLLYEALLRSDEAAFTYLYQLMYGRLAGYVWQNSGTTEQARELVHETIIAFLFRLRNKQYQWRDEAELTTYITAIAHNIWRYQQRKKQLQMSNLPASSLADTLPDEEDPSFENRRVAMEKGLTQLGEKCRQAIQLYYWQRLSMQEIARRLGWANEAVARKEKSRCLSSLRAKLAMLL